MRKKLLQHSSKEENEGFTSIGYFTLEIGNNNYIFIALNQRSNRTSFGKTRIKRKMTKNRMKQRKKLLLSQCGKNRIRTSIGIHGEGDQGVLSCVGAT
jgi:hypothetical protein